MICGEASENIADSGNSGGGSNEDNDVVLASIKCTYVEMDNPHEAKWWLHTCEEYRQEAKLCQSPYKNAVDGPPFNFVPCKTLCDQFTDQTSGHIAAREAYCEIDPDIQQREFMLSEDFKEKLDSLISYGVLNKLKE